ncbi:MAG: hypothetical protein ABI596_06870 [Pyrinomonadaceae bacterium]
MRKMLMRICLGVNSPGGPCALALNIGSKDVGTEKTLVTISGRFKWPERFSASISRSKLASGVEREWTAQCLHGSVGLPKAFPPAFCSGVDSLSIDSICL